MNILAIFAHPDDETMLAGGTLALLAKWGADVYYVCATRGEGGEMGEPPLCTRERLGEVREQELRCAVKSLGGKDITFFNYYDPVVGENNQLFPYTEDMDFLVSQLCEHIRRVKPRVLITHGSNGEYGHPAHKITYLATRLCIEKLGDGSPLLYSVQAYFPEHPKPRLANQDSLAHLIIDVTNVINEKIEAALCHQTQHALFIRHTSEELGRKVTVPETILGLESLHRIYPPVRGVVEDDFADFIRSTGYVKLPNFDLS
jgi:LmbE family N-acetylglucosaminyl deacetylase